MSSGGTTPAALTVTTSVSNFDLTSSWIRCAIEANRLDEELKSKGVEQLFIRLCEQVAKVRLLLHTVKTSNKGLLKLLGLLESPLFF